MQGVVLLAVGSDAYARWAINMAVSLRFHSPKVRIQCITSEQLRPVIQSVPQLFDVVTTIEATEFTHANGKMFPAKIKTNLYKYLAFETNLYLDCDGAAMRDVTPLFNLQAEFATDVQGCCAPHEMEFNAMKWARPEVVRQHFGLQEKAFCAINSSFMLIRKGSVCEKLFARAHENLLTTPFPEEKFWHKWGRGKGHQPDELYFNTALAQLGIEPHHYPAVFFRMKSQGFTPPVSQLVSVHYCIGLFGNESTNHFTALNTYDNVLRPAWAAVMGAGHVYKAAQLIRHKFANTKA